MFNACNRAITRPNFYMKLNMKLRFTNFFSEHLVLHNVFSFEFSLQFMKLGLFVYCTNFYVLHSNSQLNYILCRTKIFKK